MENNVFTNKELYSLHYNLDNRQRRLDDFKKIYTILKSHLEPKSRAQINEEKIFEYIELYKNENKDFIKKLLNCINHISFEKFCSDTYEQLEIFNSNIKGKKYIYVIGVNDQVGSSSANFNIYKSNLWMFMLIYDKLETKPFDIVLNVKIAIQLYGDTVEYLIVDDCSYTGTQIVVEVLYSDASETLYKYPNSYLIRDDIYKKTLFKPVKKHNISIHLFIPYMSYIAFNKLQELKLLTCYNITTYEKYILNELRMVLPREDLVKLFRLYSDFYGNHIDPSEFIPIFFDHKIADTISTLELILTKGQVLDNHNLRLIFIDACDELYGKIPQEDILDKILYCPIPPYHSFQKLLKENLK